MFKSFIAFVTIAALVAGTSVYAQQPDSTPGAPAVKQAPRPETKSEKIEVTGSRIKRIEAEGAIPVQIIDRAQIEKSGFSTLSDIIREIPASSFGSIREQSNRGSPGFAGVNLRGLGGKYTLVLLDGRRLASDPIFDAVDIGEFPTAMIERIDILKGGASAIYGSDAVGGVVNIITRKDFSGVTATTSVSQPSEKGGGERKVDAVGGGSLGPVRVIVAATFRDKDEIYAKDREFIGQGWSTTGSPGTFAPITMALKDGKETWNTKTKFRADPRCQNTALTRLNNIAGDEYCEYNYETVRTISPSLQQKGVLIKGDLEVNDRLAVYALLKGTQRVARDLVAPLPANNVDVKNKTAVLAIKNALGTAGSDIDPEAGDGVRINYRTTELGLRDTLSTERNTTGVLGFKGNLYDSWDWDFSYSASQVKRQEKGQGGFWNQVVLLDLIKQGRFNPFDPNENGNALTEASAVPTKNQRSEMQQATFVINGDATTLPNGPLSIALGASVVKENYKTDADELTLAKKIPGSSSQKGGGERSNQAVFAEASAPITNSWDVGLAARVDNYAKYGTGFSPRLSSSYKFSDWLLRGSAGTGFRAPTLQEERVTENSAYPSFVDNKRCQDARATGNQSDILSLCKESQYPNVVTAPDSLETEKMVMANLGAIYSPSTKFNVGLDTWYIRIKDRIGVPDLSLLTSAEAKGDKSYEKYGITVLRDSSGRLTRITSPAANLAKQELAGIDLDAGATIGNAKDLQLGWNLDSSYQLFNKEAAFEGQALQNRIGEADRPQWRANNTISLVGFTDHRLSVTARTTSSMKKVNPDLGKLPVYTEYDSQYRMDNFFKGNFAVGMLNLSNAKPPKDESNNPTLNYDIYSYAGRTYYASLSQGF